MKILSQVEAKIRLSGYGMFILLIVSMSYVITIVEFTQWPLVLMVVFLRVAVMIKLSAYGMFILVNV